MKTLRLGLMFWAAAALAQFPFPGQSPYPNGNPYPGGRRNPQQQQQQQPQNSGRSNRPLTSTTDGMIRRVSGNQLVIQPDDHRVVWFRITAQTTANQSGNKVDVGVFPPGDRVSVDANEDQEGNLTAVEVSWERAGTASERAAAQETWDMPGAASAMAPAGAPRRSASNVDDDDRPILRRQNNGDAPPANPPAPAAPDAPPAPQPPPAQAANAPAPDSTDDSASSRPATQLAPAAAPADPDDPGRPVLRHGAAATARQQDPGASNAAPQPAATPAGAGSYSANNSPSIVGAGAGNGTQSASIARPPASQPILPQEDPLIQKVREAAYNFSSSLPNFFCQQMTTRYRTQNVRQGWDTVDLVTADVAYENGQESYKNIKVGNGSAVQSMDQVGGTRSTGEFSSMLQDLMSESTGATFRRDVTDTIHGRNAIVFKVDVPRERSHWRIEAPSQLYYTAYRGSIWVDKATSRVLRIELQSRNLPAPFPFDTVESATDYDFIRLAAGEQEFLLPANAEVLSCERGTSFCSRNRIEFRNYKKFDAATSISFK
jgi:hypothetical protein